MDTVLITAGLAIAVLAAAGLALARRRTRMPHDPATPLDALLVPVEHLGADEDWSPAAAVHVERHPLDTTAPLPFGEDLVPAHFFDDLIALNPVVLDGPELSFTSEWALAGTRRAETGDTAAMEAVPA